MMSDKEISKIDLGKYKTDGKKGLILEVDLEYPQELHDIHNDYPITPEKVKVSKNMLSDYCKKIVEKYNISIGLVSKPIPTLRDKTEYVLHYCNLQLYLDLGLKIKEVHRVLKFDQSPWLKQYIDFNIDKRMHAKNSFEKDFFKLMNNIVFGKTMENLRKRVDVRLVTNEKKLETLIPYVKDNEKGGRTAKGIKKNVIKNNIKHEDYKNTLINNEQMHHKMKTITSQRHQLGSYEINKVSNSCFDDKCYIHDNGTSSYAYGHYRI